MKILQAKYNGNTWKYISSKEDLNHPLVLVFGDRFLLEKEEIIASVKAEFPYENLVFGSSAGEILGTRISEGEVAVTAIEFNTASYTIRTENIFDHKMNAVQLGVQLITKLPQQGLRHAFVISEGSFINGSDLVKGMEDDSQKGYSITGGLCGDGPRFENTYAGLGEPKKGEVVVIGFYGETLEFSYASVGGWIPFGPERLITKSEKNILYELDDRPALDLYSKYLGEKASELPQASLLYPLHVREAGKKKPVVRTILNIDRQDNAMILAGDVPQGARVQLMMASADALLEGSFNAATLAMKDRKEKPSLAILVSCIGRKLVLDQRVEEEIEEVEEVIGAKACITGFYSYGEIAPFHGEPRSELHNQTMTLTLISE